MTTSSIFSQILPLIPRSTVERTARRTGASKGTKGFSNWDHLVAMLFSQLGGAQTLREIKGGLASSVGKLNHLGMRQPPAVSTLSYANQHRTAQFFAEVFFALYHTLRQQHGGRHRFKFKHPLLSIDSTLIEVSLKTYDWAHYRQTKGAVKLHMMLDHAGYLPSMCVITQGNVNDLPIARQMPLERGVMAVFDRGYTDYAWFDQLTDQGVKFVTRLKSNAAYQVIEEYGLPRRQHLVADEDIVLSRCASPRRYRLVTVQDPESAEVFTFLTNHLTLSPATIAAIYKERWQIELLFKALKQNLQLKSFLGQSANAVKIQIWTALIALLLIKYLKHRATHKWSLSNLHAMLRMNLFVHRSLVAWLDNPFQPPPDPPPTQQGVLSFAGA